MRKDLDERLPFARVGESINLTLLNNYRIRGTLIRLDARQLQLRTATGTQVIPYRQLSTDSRLRVDESERDTWLEERALEEVLRRL